MPRGAFTGNVKVVSYIIPNLSLTRRQIYIHARGFMLQDTHGSIVPKLPVLAKAVDVGGNLEIWNFRLQTNKV